VGKKKDISKRFYFQVVYCEMTSKDDLHARVKNMPVTPAEDSLALRELDLRDVSTKLMTERSDLDEDGIEVGASRMNLKDPVSSHSLLP
jgi:E3 SUMO-protein ligase PIAS1